MYIDFLVWLWYNMNNKGAPIMIIDALFIIIFRYDSSFQFYAPLENAHTGLT